MDALPFDSDDPVAAGADEMRESRKACLSTSKSDLCADLLRRIVIR